MKPTAKPCAAVADLVDGVWQPCSRELGVVLEDPATGEPVGRGVASAPERVERALAAAVSLHADESWAGLADEVRAGALEAAAASIEARVPEIVRAEAYATGVPLAQTSGLGVIVGGAFRMAAARLRAGLLHAGAVRPDGRSVEVRRAPLGPALCVVPYNAPAPMAAHKAASALAAGCPVVVKAPELAPSGTQLLVEAAAEGLAAAGAPPALLQLLHGDGATGARLVADDRIRVVSFTGGTAAGRDVAAVCGRALKPVQLELGGNNPLIVMPDADVDVAGRIAAELLTTLNGQWCRALGRLVVPARLLTDVLDAAAGLLAALRVGDPLDPDTAYGPLAHSRHRAKALAAVEALTAAGAKAHALTGVPERGNFLPPLLVTGAPEAATREEIFGPVATVHPYADETEAVALANSTGYGLEGYVVGRDETAALSVARRVRAGEVKVNGSSVLSLHPETPRPAWGLSGLVDEGTDETILHFTGARVTGVEGAFALHSPGTGAERGAR
ncbi:aldehyde dehydrogenase family protein [Streptomyces sp. NPDC000229]|uniref:aldehyde dehydrogenase family protein n=1 Tax=Streptomyces sp. NPDC000229 TaxID=3154247 RepID=UPI00332CAB33